MKELESARARVKQLEYTTAKLESTTATVERFKRTFELLIIKHSEDDLAPLELTVNKHVSLIRCTFKSYNLPKISRH